MSNSKIYKYPLVPLADGIVRIEMPKHAKVLSFGRDPRGALCIWADVGISMPLEERRFQIVMTAEDVPKGAFIGTYVDLGLTGLVLHCFEIGELQDG